LRAGINIINFRDIYDHCEGLLKEIFDCADGNFTSYGYPGMRNNDIDFFNSRLNEDQRLAVSEALSAKNLYLLHGPPGTGKTETLTEMILQMASIGKKVLVCSPSNVAVDTVAERLLTNNLDDITEICRIGHPVRILEEVKDICVDSILDSRYNLGQKIEKIVKDMNIYGNNKLDKLIEIEQERKSYTQELFRNSQIIFATIAGSGSRELYECLEENEFSFDVVIIDETSQAREAETFIPILLGKKLILGGDHCQLAPVIKNRIANDAIKISLFEKLFNRYNVSKRTLNIQYRSNAKIMKFSSDYFYNSRLISDKSVIDQVALSLVNSSKLNMANVKYIFSSPLILIDTSKSRSYEGMDNTLKSKYNEGEATIVENFILYLLGIGVQEEHIGVIAPYKAQVSLIMDKLADKREIEIETVDSFQGREKEIIIISTTRSNSSGDLGFLTDERRMNVALTRAKKMLVLIGDMWTLSSYPFLYEMYQYFVKNALQINAGSLLSMKKRLNLNIRAESYIPKHLREYIVKRIDAAKDRFINEATETLNRGNKQKEDNYFFRRPQNKFNLEQAQTEFKYNKNKKGISDGINLLNIDFMRRFDLSGCEIITTWVKENIIKDREKTAREHAQRNALATNRMKNDFKGYYKTIVKDITDESYTDLDLCDDMFADESIIINNNNKVSNNYTQGFLKDVTNEPYSRPDQKKYCYYKLNKKG
jgi:superfamily I DNA and/or RNA helicase